MAATLLPGALSFHVADSAMASIGSCPGSRASPYPAQLEPSAGKLRFRSLSRVSSCLPLLLSADNPFRQQTTDVLLRNRVCSVRFASRDVLLQRSRNRVRNVRVGSLKDSQREAVHDVDEEAKPIELGLPVSSSNGREENGCEPREGAETHSSSKSPEEIADEEGASLKEEVKAEEPEGGVSGTVKGTIVATVLLLACVGAFGALGFVYKEQINDILTQFSDFLEGQANSDTTEQSFIFVCSACANSCG